MLEEHNRPDNWEEVQQLQWKLPESDEAEAWQRIVDPVRPRDSDVINMTSVRHSWKAKEQREAQEIAEFEAIEHDLMAETALNRREKQQQQQLKQLELAPPEQEQVLDDSKSDVTDWELSDLSLVSDFDGEDRSRWQRTRHELFDDSIDNIVNPARMFANKSFNSVDDMIVQCNELTDRSQEHSETEICYGDLPSELSAISLDGSVPWYDCLSSQPQRSVEHERCPDVVAANVHASSNDQEWFASDGDSDRHQSAKYRVLSANPGCRRNRIQDTMNLQLEGGAPVSSLAQTVLADFQHGDNSDRDSLFYEGDTSPIGSSSTSTRADRVAPSARPTSFLQERPKSTIEHKRVQLQDQAVHITDQIVQKLAVSRDEYARYGQEQRTLIEKEWEQERTKLKEEKLRRRQCKLRTKIVPQPNPNECGEVAMLKAQIVQMQVDEKARVGKWKAASDKLRQHIYELEEKNRDLSKEIEVMKKGCSKQWVDYDQFLNETRGGSGLMTKSSVTSTFPSVLSEKNGSHTMNGFVCIKEVDAKGWSPSDDSLPEIDEKMDCMAFSDCNHHNTVNSNEWERDGLVVDPHRSFESGVSTGGINCPSGKEVFTSDSSHGGKRELLYTDGSRKIVFPNGSEKDVDASGRVVIKFANGDHQELFPDTGVSVYHYYEARTKLTTYPDNRRVYEFANQQTETTLPDGTIEIQFADGIKKTIYVSGDEFSVFPDGTTMMEQLGGLREVTLGNDKTLRFLPDGQITVRSDVVRQDRLLEST
uniref:Centromere protein J C-terminal domain-containing protein n=1 Tax=Hyaloperonospora arabidopsidis (strain Emoy2) TaxID=559515 RepID=M4BGW6_HYAAE